MKIWEIPPEGSPIMTRSGDYVLLYTTFAPGDYPIVGRIIGRQRDGVQSWTASGHWAPASHCEHVFHLVGSEVLPARSNMPRTAA